MVEVSVSARWAHAAMRKLLKQEVTRISAEALEEITYRAQEFAQEEYEKAEYAGVDPGQEIYVSAEEAGPMSYRLKAEGEIAKFVEFGTGIYHSPGYKNQYTNKMFWIFNARGRDIIENGFVERAKPRYTYYEKKPVYLEDHRGLNRATNAATREFLGYETVRLKEPKLDTREGYWFTYGSPANNVLEKTRVEMLNRIVPEVVIEKGGRTLG